MSDDTGHQKKSGPKSKYNPELHIEIAKVAGKGGLTDEEISESIGIARSTLSEWKKKYPEFAEALADGKKYSDEKVVASLFKKSIGYVDEDNVELFHFQGRVIEHKIAKRIQPDTTSIIFWLKNRRPDEWRDRHDINVTGKVDYQKQRSKLTDIIKKVKSEE